MKWVVRIFGVLGGVALILVGALFRALLPTWGGNRPLDFTNLVYSYILLS